MYLKMLATKYIYPKYEKHVTVSVEIKIGLVLKSFQQDIMGLIFQF